MLRFALLLSAIFAAAGQGISPPGPSSSSNLQGSRVLKKDKLAVGLGVGLGGGFVFFALVFAVAHYLQRSNKKEEAVSAPVQTTDTPDAAVDHAPLRGDKVVEEAASVQAAEAAA